MKRKANVLRPEFVDEKEFFMDGRFMPGLAAKNMAARIGPLAFVNEDFFWYKDGLWIKLKEEKLKELISAVLKNESSTRRVNEVTTILKAASYEDENFFDSSHLMINLLNGVIAASKFAGRKKAPPSKCYNCQLLTHKPEYRMWMQVQTEFRKFAQAPNWEKFLSEAFQNDQASIRILQKFAGYLLVPTTKYQRALVLSGPGGNGKSTIISVLKNVLGDVNTLDANIEDFLGGSFNLPYLQQKLLFTSCIGIDSNKKKRRNDSYRASVLEKLISGDMVSGELKYRNPINIFPTAKFIFVTNEEKLPEWFYTRTGLERKLLVLRLKTIFRTKDHNSNFFEILREEREGILNWMLRGTFELIRDIGF